MARKRSYDTLIGGSVGWNQLLTNLSSRSQTLGITITVNSDGSITASGTATGTNNLWFKQSFTFQANRVYLLKGSNGNGLLGIGSQSPIKDTGSGCLYMFSSAVSPQIVYGFTKGVTYNETLYPEIIDLTQMLGSTIADHIYSLETATSGAGIAKLREWGFIGDAYIPYDAGSIKSVEASAKVTRDANNNIIGNYPLDSSLTLRGIPKLTDGKLWYDGDRYEADGTVTRKYGIRAYQEGDETSDTMITDGTNTVYKLTSTTTESADPFTNPQTVDPDGTEEYVTANGVPVGHETRYQL